jgi:SNF2 family DNA or RNA helicase
MYDYQKRGAAWLYDNKRALLCDAPGLGKTVQAIAAAYELMPARILVLCKNPFTLTWQDEVEKWTGVRPQRLRAQGRQAKLQDWLHKRIGFLIVGWATFRVFPELLNVKWDCVIADESHTVKNKKTKTFKMFKQLKAGHLYLLTATPFSLHLAEVWTSLNAIAPQTFRSYWRFHKMFVKEVMIGQFPKIVGGQNTDVFADVVGRYLLKRRVRDVMPDARPPRVFRYRVDMRPQQAKAYQQMQQQLIAELENQKLAAPTKLAQLTRLRQIASTTATLWDKDYSGKLDAAVELIKDEPGQVVVATTYRDTVFALEQRLKGERVDVLVGGVKHGAVQARFAAGESRVLIMTRETGGESLNLDSASLMLILEMPWSPARQEQLHGRVWRPASDKPGASRIIYLHHPKSVDDLVAKRTLHRTKLNVAALLQVLKDQERRGL